MQVSVLATQVDEQRREGEGSKKNRGRDWMDSSHSCFCLELEPVNRWLLKGFSRARCVGKRSYAFQRTTSTEVCTESPAHALVQP